MRTTKKELLEMINDISEDTQIILKVRGNTTEDYNENEIIAFENDNGVLIIQDKLSY